MFLTSAEIALIRQDYEQVVRSPESCRVRIEYKTWFDVNALPDIDPVYGVDRRLVRDEPVVVNDVTCLQQIIKPKDIQFLATQIMEVGDCIFYFSDQLHLEQPDPLYPLVPNTLIFFDVAEQGWIPKLPGEAPLLDFLILRIGNKQIGQPVPCHIQK